jgi:NRPS condensation-like uncharacterized protein
MGRAGEEGAVSVRDDGHEQDDYIRSLSDAEQGLDLWETSNASSHIVRVMVYEGTFDAGLFERALHQLVERRPLLHSRIVRPPGAAPYFAPCSEWPVVSVEERVDGEHWRREFERQMSVAVGVAEDPVLTARVLEGDGRGEVVLSCHHSVCDGRSMTGFCRDLIHEYEWLQRGAPGDPEGVVGAVSPPLEELLPAGLTGSGRQAVFGDWVARMTELEKSPPGFVLKAGPPGTQPAARHVLTYELAPVQVDALNGLAHANGTTVGGAISAAILRAAVGLGGPDAEEECGFITNIDLRPHLREPVPICNMGMYASSSIDVLGGIRTSPFWDVARSITDRVRLSIESLQAFCGVLMSKQMFEVLRDAGLRTYWPQLMTANLGRLDLPAAAESFRVRTIHGGTPMLGHGPFMFCSAVGLAGTIMIDVNYESPDVPDDVARAFGDSLLDRLTIESGAPGAHQSPAPAAE